MSIAQPVNISIRLSIPSLWLWWS